MNNKALLEIYRSEIWMGYLRTFPIILDGKKIGKIKSDQRFRFEIAPGNHSVITGIEFFRSNLVDFDIKEGQRVILRISKKYVSFWKKLLNLFLFSVCITIGTFFGIIGIGIGSGIGSIFLIKSIGKLQISYIDCIEAKT